VGIPAARRRTRRPLTDGAREQMMMNARVYETQPADAIAENRDGLLDHLRRQLRSAEAAAAHAPINERAAHRARANRLTCTIFAVRGVAGQAPSP
jgi:hypothetical protein